MSRLLILFVLGLSSLGLFGQGDFPERPSPPRIVNDLANVISAGNEAQLEAKLVAFNNRSSTQIAVVTLNSVGGYEISDYTFQLGEKWGVGQKGKDNGVLILVAVQDRKTFIATGYGVEDVVTDATAKLIVDNSMIPKFKQGDYYEGLKEASDIIIDLTDGKFTAEDLNKKYSTGLHPVLVIFIIIFLIIVLSAIFGKDQGGGTGGGRKYRRTTRGGWTAGSGGWISSGGSLGGGGGFGGSSGGFGGFGGGSFGGGGAGGSW